MAAEYDTEGNIPVFLHLRVLVWLSVYLSPIKEKRSYNCESDCRLASEDISLLYVEFIFFGSAHQQILRGAISNQPEIHIPFLSDQF
jgi:hypothetical protein